MDAVLFVGHGSKDPQGNEEVRKFVDTLALPFANTLKETCFIEFADPDIRQGIERCIKRGATRVALVPIILFAAGHAKLHVPEAIDWAREKYPHITFRYGRPIGMHEGVLEILRSRLAACLKGKNDLQDTAILLVGRGSSDPDANSDLYKVARLLWEDCGARTVETAFMGVTFPLLEQGLERCLQFGANRVIVLPYFLFTGVLIKRMERIVRAFSLEHKQCTFLLAEYFGFHEKLRDIILDRCHEALFGEVKMNCDLCQYRLMAKHEHGHHHDHHHGHHDHHHHHSHHHHDHHHGHGDDR
jgi:sirohydrochlorin cobaltochelatase